MKSLLCTLAFFSFSFSVARAADVSDVVVAPGLFTDIEAPRGVHVNVGNGGLIRVVDRGHRLRITGRKMGVTQIRIGEQDIRVSVVKEPIANLFEKFERVIRKKRGLILRFENQTLWVRGRLLRWEDWQDLAELSTNAGAAYRFGADVDPVMSAQIQAALKAQLRKASLPETTLEIKPTATALVPTEPVELSKRIAEVLNPYGFKVETSTAALSLEPLVRVRIVVAELRKDRMLQYGIKWPSAVHAQLLPSPKISDSELIDLDITALESNGFGKVLASPTLLCRSGKEAKFFAGGEIPIKLATYKSSQVVWKQYGVVLKIKPLADFSGRMSIALETEVSGLDTSHAVEGTPGITTNRIESHFDLASSRTIALSGLIKKESSENSSGLPGLGNLPILGPLFAGKGFQENRTELVVFVTPEVATESSLGENPIAAAKEIE